MTSQSDRKPVLRVLQGQQRDPRMRFVEHLRAKRLAEHIRANYLLRDIPCPSRTRMWIRRAVSAAKSVAFAGFAIGCTVGAGLGYWIASFTSKP